MLANIASKPVVIVLLDSIGKYTRLGDAERVKHWIETGDEMPAAIKRAVVEVEGAPPRRSRTSGARNVPSRRRRRRGSRPPDVRMLPDGRLAAAVFAWNRFTLPGYEAGPPARSRRA